MQQFVNQHGETYWAPYLDRDRENQVISNYAHWECAFRVFSNIYTRKFPHRAAELLQYSHIIQTALTTYSWENVYMYDHEFRIHMSRHPDRLWAIILNQAYTMCLKDRHKDSNQSGSNNRDRNGHRYGKSRDVCYHFNKGRCTYGENCKFEHKCLICSKFGHGSINCRKNDRNNNNQDRRDSRDSDKNKRDGNRKKKDNRNERQK